MIIVGLSPLDKDATATLMIDGRVVAAVAEERLSRQKMHAGFPYQALEMVLKLGNVNPRDIDCIAYAFLDARTERRLMRQQVLTDWRLNRASQGRSLKQLIREAEDRCVPRNEEVPGLRHPDERMEKPWWKRQLYALASADGLIGDTVNALEFNGWLDQASRDHRRYERELITGLCEFGLADKLQRVEHHQTHAANAFYCSGYERALVVTIDAYGSGLSASVSIGDEQGLKRIDTIDTPYSLGTFYESVTSALGFRPDRHAGKIVGLAAYGDSTVVADVLRSLIVWDGHRPRWRRASDVYLSRHLACKFPKIDLAAAYQTVLEEVVQRWIAHHVDTTGIDHLVLSGGVVANVKLNQRLHELHGVRQIYIHPNMGDGGCGTGAAIVKSLEYGARPDVMRSAYLGPEYAARDVQAALQEAGVAYTHHEDIDDEVARLVAENHVVARCSGPMEYGPRALGNRSILYPATDPGVNQWLNERLHRTEFMPFAPATLAEDASECYEDLAGAEFAAQFMTITFNCTAKMKRQCPAAVHVDGTARPQLVSEQTNAGFYRILQEYKRLTGISSMINTSFNMHEEPIVCTPGDAVRSFLAGGVDYLAIGEFLVAAPHILRGEQVRPEAATV